MPVCAPEGGRGRRPSTAAPVTRTRRVKPVGVDELARRYAAGVDLWSGEPLSGEDKLAWERIQVEQARGRKNRLGAATIR